MKSLSSGRNKVLIPLLTVFMAVFLFSCRTYYQQQQKFNTYFERGEIEKAEAAIAGNSRSDRRNVILLYYLNRGTVAQLLGDYEESNRYFEKAYLYTEDVRIRAGDRALSLVSNPNALPYEGEDFEVLLINYYKVINFLKLGDYESALVECRRMNIRLQIMEDQYSQKERYRRDAFIHNLMGIIYDAAGDHNSAFIAYRNAYNIYVEDKQYLGLDVPEQLKLDLVRAAQRTGFHEQANRFAKEFELKTLPLAGSSPEVVFFWHNGLGPVKHEWSINFAVVRSSNMVTFVNTDLGLVFSYNMSESRQKETGLSDLSVIRLAFPKYIERPQFFDYGEIKVGNRQYTFHKGQNVNHIAFQSLNDRMLREVGNTILRFAIKKAGEMAVREANKDAGAIIGLIGAITEKADTRNWQTLPHAIYYSRVPLTVNDSKFTFIAKNKSTSAKVEEDFHITVTGNQTLFYFYHTMNSYPPVF